MKDLLLRALDTARAKGATYADVRYVESEVQVVAIKDGSVEALTSGVSRGFGVRVIANGGWGFASSSRLTLAEMDVVAATAVRIAKASSSVLREPVDIGEPMKIEDLVGLLSN